MSSTSPLVQYIVVRKDLAWPAGALIAQACHAATSVIHMFYNNKDTQDYLADIDNMHKIVLQAPSEDALKELHAKLESNSVDHKMWIEQPENVPSCIAARPYRKVDVQSLFKGFKLFQ